MTGRPLNDAQLAAALRAHVPSHAPAGLRARITAQIVATPQAPRLPRLFGLRDADPVVRRRALLLVAAVALLATLSVAAIVGAWLRSQDPTDDLTRSTEADAFVLASYGRLTELPPFRLVLSESMEGTLDYVYFYDGVDILREEFAGTPGSASLFASNFTASNELVGARLVWVVSEGDDEHPISRLGLAARPNCASGWDSLETTELIGRPTRHLRCTDAEARAQPFEFHVWIDIETGLPLRFGAPVVSGTKVLELTYTEVTEIEFGPQPPHLFVVEGETISREEFNCATEGQCASPGPSEPEPLPTPIVEPPPALGSAVAPPDLDAFVTAAHAAYERSDPIDIVIDHAPSSVGHWSHWQRDGLGSFREEKDSSPLFDSPVIWLTTGGRTYESWSHPDGREWRDWGPTVQGIPSRVTMELPYGCGIGWTYLGDDLVLGRGAAHIACGFQEFWIDREWMLVTRAHDRDPLGRSDPGAGLSQVVSVTFGPLPAELFAPPPPGSVWR